MYSAHVFHWTVPEGGYGKKRMKKARWERHMNFIDRIDGVFDLCLGRQQFIRTVVAMFIGIKSLSPFSTFDCNKILTSIGLLRSHLHAFMCLSLLWPREKEKEKGSEREWERER